MKFRNSTLEARLRLSLPEQTRGCAAFPFDLEPFPVFKCGNEESDRRQCLVRLSCLFRLACSSRRPRVNRRLTHPAMFRTHRSTRFLRQVASWRLCPGVVFFCLESFLIYNSPCTKKSPSLNPGSETVKRRWFCKNLLKDRAVHWLEIPFTVK